LLPRFLGLFATVQPERRLSLALYLLVLVYSGLLTLYYLFLDPTTRGWRVQESWGGAVR